MPKTSQRSVAISIPTEGLEVERWYKVRFKLRLSHNYEAAVSPIETTAMNDELDLDEAGLTDLNG